MRLVESKQDLLHVVRGNVLKRKCNKSEADLGVLENQYSDLGKQKGKF